MSTHLAIVTVARRAPLDITQVPTLHPGEGEVRIRTEWTSMGPLELHQADGGLLVHHPQILGDSVAGTVVEIGPDVEEVKEGDKVGRDILSFLLADLAGYDIITEGYNMLYGMGHRGLRQDRERVHSQC